MNKTLLCVLFACCGLCHATELPLATQQEITHLFAYLENSDCQFNRNGTWYAPKEAVAHLTTKYEYLLRKNLVSTAESFIEQAATKSSMTGAPYQVQCKDAPSVESALWFNAELVRYRQAGQ